MKTKITYEEHCMLVGLAFIAEDTDKTMMTIVRSVAKITGEVLDDHDYGHAADLVYSPLGGNPTESINCMLSQLGIVHEKEARDDEETEAGDDVPES